MPCVLCLSIVLQHAHGLPRRPSDGLLVGVAKAVERVGAVDLEAAQLVLRLVRVARRAPDELPALAVMMRPAPRTPNLPPAPVPADDASSPAPPPASEGGGVIDTTLRALRACTAFVC